MPTWRRAGWGGASLLLLLLSCDRGDSPATVAPSLGTTPAGGGRSLVLGKISGDAFSKIEEWQPLARYLTSSLRRLGVVDVDVRVLPHPLQMGEALAGCEVDLYFDNAYAAAVARSRSGVDYLLSRIKQGPATKQAVFITRADSSIRRLDQLAGRTLALEEPDSASGYLLPLLHLLDADLMPVAAGRSNARPGPSQVGYVFSRDDNNTLAWVAARRIIAGAVDSEAFDALAASGNVELVAIGRTASMTRNQLGLVSPCLTGELRTGIKQALVVAERVAGGALPPETSRFAEVAEDRALLAHLDGALERLSAALEGEANE